MKRDVEVGTGAALIPRGTVSREVEAGTLVAIPLEGNPPSRPVGIVHDRHHVLSSAATRFLAALRDLGEERAEDSGVLDHAEHSKQPSSAEVVEKR